MLREPTGKVWHAVGGLGQGGEGRHIAPLGLFATADRRGRIGADVLFMLCLIHDWFKISANLRHAVKNLET